MLLKGIAPDLKPWQPEKDAAKWKRAAERLAIEVNEIRGACPLDSKDWLPPFDCEEMCPKRDGEEWRCWLDWALAEDDDG